MDKIKAVNPKIIVRGNVDKPHYLIEYYDLSDNEWHIRYGSYYLANVKEWLKTCFEVTNVDVAPVKHGHWVYNQNGHDWGLGAWECSLCHSVNNNLPIDKRFSPYVYAGSKYCPNCGAKMDGGENKFYSEQKP